MKLSWLQVIVALVAAVACFSLAAGSTELTATFVFENDECTQPAQSVSMRQDLGCRPQQDRRRPVCEQDGTIYTVADCMYVGEALSKAFLHWQPYLLVETLDSVRDDGWCDGNVEYSNAYRLDKQGTTCFTNHLSTPITSSQIALSETVITYTTYDDPDCQNLASQVDLSWPNVTDGRCFGGMRFHVSDYVGTNNWMMKAVTVFDDNTCSDTPVKLTLTQSFDCIVDIPRLRDVGCKAAGAAHYTISNCTSDYYSSAVQDTFGSYTPQFIVEEFYGSWCYNDHHKRVDVYIADDLCHANADDMTSFQITITANKSIEFTTFGDTICGVVGNRTTLTKQEVLSNICVSESDDRSKRYSLEGLKERPVIGNTEFAVRFEDSSCNGIPVIVIVASKKICSPSDASLCDKVSGDMHQYYECVEDIAAHTKSLFSGTLYLIMEKYVAGTHCSTLSKTVVYRAGGKCHPNINDDSYFRITLSIGNSLTFATYPTSSCRDLDAEYITIGTKYINTDVCYDGKVKFYVNRTATPTVPKLDVDSMTREQIMFPEWLWEPSSRRIFVSD